jgi:cytoskeletal protein CcmA (bactofilin family)
MGRHTETENTASNLNIISPCTELHGDINTTGDMRIDGKLTGNFSSSQKLVIGASGAIEGIIQCNDCDISGEVTGDLFIENLLALKSTANVTGKIYTNKILIELGAKYSGICTMGSPHVEKPLKVVENPPKK